MIDTTPVQRFSQSHSALLTPRIDQRTPSHGQASVSEMSSPRQQPLSPTNKHYEQFQQALYMLKVSVEELWQLELEQLRNHPCGPRDLLKPTFDLQIPSIYSCRAVLPMASQTIHSKLTVASSASTPLIQQPSPAAEPYESLATKMRPNDEMIQPETSPLFDERRSTESVRSIRKKQKRYASGDKLNKQCRKKAFLHLNFRCPKHLG